MRLTKVSSILICIGIVLIPYVNAGGKKQTIKKIKNLVTKFATDDQLGKILDALSLDLYNMEDTTTMANNAINIVLKSLTGTQMTQGVQIYNQLVNDFGGMDAAVSVLNQVIGVFNDNLGTIVTQIQTKIQSSKDSGKTQAQCLKQQYKMINKKFTKKMVKKIMTQIKNTLSSSDWNIIKNDLGNLIFFSNYGL
ncbi:hypothetical protein DdX_08142 [Ditylenchus destructor]|uniref:Uncharacterized protein n=1 Tax=Ditylenchus destructor TaxID=166010 RepID=A0AAD4N7Z0_9BILA|nr:hypothetical protein DdX_08142 [Ditylenchus destructor]